MQRTCVLWLSCTVVIYFFSSITTVYGRKCSGRWAIHACYGGNGKRSGPPSDSSDTLDRSKPFILGQLLLKNRSLMPELLSNYPDDSSDLIEQDNVYPDNDDVVREQILERQQILERVNSILSDMHQQRTVDYKEKEKINTEEISVNIEQYPIRKRNTNTEEIRTSENQVKPVLVNQNILSSVNPNRQKEVNRFQMFSMSSGPFSGIASCVCSFVRSDKIRQDLEQFQEVYYKEQTTNQLMGLISIAYDMTHRLYMRVILPSFSSRILFLPVGLSILCQGIICIFANDSDTLSQVLIRTIRGRFPHNHTHMSANDATDYKSEPSNVTRDSLSISLHAKFIDVKSTYSDNNELNSHLKNTSERSDDIMDSVSGDFIQSATTSINDSFDYHGSDASDFVTDMEKNFKETRQTTKVFRRGRSSYVTSQCPSQNVRSLCPWKTVLVSDNTRVPQDIQIRTCVSSIPPRDIGLNDIECENITITKDFRLLNCAASNCIERVVVQVGCIPVFSCHIYSPP